MSLSSSNHGRQLSPSRTMRKVPARVLNQKSSSMPMSLGCSVEAPCCQQSRDRALVPLDGALGNAEIAELLDEPLMEGAAGFEPSLTSDQWSSLIQQRQAAGRPLHLAEVR